MPCRDYIDRNRELAAHYFTCGACQAPMLAARARILEYLARMPDGARPCDLRAALMSGDGIGWRNYHRALTSLLSDGSVLKISDGERNWILPVRAPAETEP